MNKKIIEILSVLLLVIVHCVYWIMHQGVLFDAYANAYWDSSFQLLKDACYFRGMASYLEGFFLGFFQWKWIGICLLILPLLLIYVIIRLITKQMNMGIVGIVVAFVPTVLLMYCQRFEDFFFIKSIITSILFICLLVCYRVREKQWRVFLLPLIVLVIFFLSNFELVILCVCLLLEELMFSSNRMRFATASIYLLLGIYFFVLYVKGSDTTPLFQVETPWMLVFPLIFVLLVMCIYSRMLKKTLPIWTNYLCGLIVVLLLVLIFLPNEQLKTRDKYGRLNVALLAGDYDKILSLTTPEKQKNEGFMPYAIYALAQKGELPEKLFQYSVNTSSFVVEAMPPQAGYTSLLNVCYFRSLGLINEAIHQAFQMGISCEYDDKYLSLCLLADLNIEKGDFLLAEKYLSKLETTFVHRKFVESRRKLIATQPQTIQMPSFDGYLYINKDQFMNLGYSLFIAKNDSKFVKDYFLCSLLLMGEYSQFCSLYNDLYAGETQIPRVYAEALIMARDMFGLPVQHTFQQSVESDWKLFMDYIQRAPTLATRYKNTWWYYSTFILEDVK